MRMNKAADKRSDGMPVGTPFSPGEFGNPKGRPTGSVDIMRRVQNLLEVRKDLPAALKAVIKSRCGGDKKAPDAIFISMLLEALQGDARAAKELLDRGFGKVIIAFALGKCNVRQIELTISLAFLAPTLVKAAIEGRLSRGIGIV